MRADNRAEPFPRSSPPGKEEACLDILGFHDRDDVVDRPADLAYPFRVHPLQAVQQPALSGGGRVAGDGLPPLCELNPDEAPVVPLTHPPNQPASFQPLH